MFFLKNSKSFLIVLPILLLLFSQNSLAQTPVIGPVNGIWTTTGSPYYITGDVTVPSGDTLIIDAGVEVFFVGIYSFSVDGLLKANGTADNMITFHGGDAEKSWKGIYFTESATVGCILDYCIVKDAGFGD